MRPSFRAWTRSVRLLSVDARRRPLFMIVASNPNGVIGLGGVLPWSIPEDRAWFLSCVRGCTVILGRRCFEEESGVIPGCDDLIVVTRRSALPGARTAPSLTRALELAQRPPTNPRPIIIAGGQAIYQEALQLAHRLYLTEVDIDCAGDAFFPLLEARERFTRTVYARPGREDKAAPRCIYRVLEPPDPPPFNLGALLPPF